MCTLCFDAAVAHAMCRAIDAPDDVRKGWLGVKGSRSGGDEHRGRGRLMPKAGDELEVDESGTDIDRELVDMVINEFDDQALEEAVLIKEAAGATVTAVGLRAEGSSRRFAWRMRVGRTGWSSWRRARSTRTTRGRRRSPSRRRSVSWLPTSC